MHSDHLLKLDSLTYSAPDGRLLARGVMATLRAGETLVVRGPNGAGKTTLLRVILGRTAPAAGRVDLQVGPADVRYLPQLANADFHLPMTLADVVRVSSRGGYDERAALELGLLEARHLRLAWNTASGGERQKTLLTSALLQNPSLLVLDEPMNHLDDQGRRLVRELLGDFVAGGARRATVLVSHDALDEVGAKPLRAQSLDLGQFAC